MAMEALVMEESGIIKHGNIFNRLSEEEVFMLIFDLAYTRGEDNPSLSDEEKFQVWAARHKVIQFNVQKEKDSLDMLFFLSQRRK